MNMHCHLLAAVVYMRESAWEISSAKAKQLLLATAQLRSCKHQQFSPLVGAFHFVLYFFQHLLKIRGKKKRQMCMALAHAVVHALIPLI